MLLEIWQNSQENTCTRVSFLIKLQGFFCQTSKSNFFTEHLWTTASHRRSIEQMFWKRFAKFTEKHLRWRYFYYFCRSRPSSHYCYSVVCNILASNQRGNTVVMGSRWKIWTFFQMFQQIWKQLWKEWSHHVCFFYW